MPKKKTAEACPETWHNRKLDDNGGMVYLTASKTFADPKHFTNTGEPIIRYAGSFYWEDAQTAYQLWLSRKVAHMSMTHDPMDDVKDPDRMKTTAKRREELYSANPFHFGRGSVKTAAGYIVVPLDHNGEPWVEVPEGKTEGGAVRYVFVPEEFKDSPKLARSREDLTKSYEAVPTKVYEEPQDEKHWYVLKDEHVRANVTQTYMDFFSGRIYSPGEGVAMYPEEFERAKAEGYATEEPVVRMEVIHGFEDDYINANFNPNVRTLWKTAGETFLATEARAAELESRNLAIPATKANKYRLAGSSYFRGESDIYGGSAH